MNLESLKKQLIQDEGYKAEVYLDSLGKPTFGIGHLLTRQDVEWFAYNNLKKGGVLTVSPERIDKVFKEDVNNACFYCKKIFSDFDSMEDELQEIIVNMMFNLGPNGFKSLTSFVDAIKNKNYKLAAKRMRTFKWYVQVKSRAKRLADRMDKFADNKLCSL